MGKILATLIIMAIFINSQAFAQSYSANTWASWASITTQVDWTFPYNSRSIGIHNGSSVPICVSFGKTPTTIANNCTDAANDVFQLPASQWTYLDNFVRPGVHIRSASTAASPVSVFVNY